MKNLVLLRHAKSSWTDPGLPDRERPLNKRGKRDAPAMGRWLRQQGVAPQLILSSPAKRAYSTAKKIAKELGYAQTRIETRDDIYMKGVEELLTLIANLDEAYQQVLLVGHNPELTELAQRLARASLAELPTCGVASIVFASTSWPESVKEGGRLALLARPPKLRTEEP